MTWDANGRRIVAHHTLLAYWRAALLRDKQNRGEPASTPIYAEDLF